MKCILSISDVDEDLIGAVDDETNRLFINDVEIPSSQWTGSGNYTSTIEGHSITIQKVADLDGNIGIRKLGDFTCMLFKHSTGDVPFTGDYNDLTNKPRIEGVALQGNKSFPELNLDVISNSKLESMLTI